MFHAHQPPQAVTPKTETAVREVHDLLPFQKYCANGKCENENENFKPAKYRCKNCGGLVASDKSQLPKKCLWGCGSTEAEKVTSDIFGEEKEEGEEE